MDTSEPSGLHEQLGSAAVSPSDSADFSAQVDTVTEAIIARVSSTSAGRPYHRVLAVLSTEFEAALLTMPETWLRRVAADIAAGQPPAPID